tara:strand:- start:327 stop:689 length:363 start_codon:yes stop_codon:yes gene_type:complete
MIEISKRDSELVQRVLHGDERDYTLLLQLYRESVYYIMLKMICNKDDAEDLTIEAFGKAFRRLASCNTSWVFSTWLFKITSNICIDKVRKKKKQKNPISMDSGYSYDDDESTIYLEVEIC